MFHTCTQQESNRDNIAHFICEKARHTAAMCVRARNDLYVFLMRASSKTNTQIFDFSKCILYIIYFVHTTHTHIHGDVHRILLWSSDEKQIFTPARCQCTFSRFYAEKHLVKVKHLPLLNRPIYMPVCGACVCAFVGIYICVCVVWCSVTRAHATTTMPRVCCANKFFLGCLFRLCFFFYHRCGTTFLFIKLYN